MGIIDTVQITSVETEPPRLVLRLHRRQSDTAIPLDSASLNGFLAAFPPSDTQTYWLRSASHSETPVLFWWRLRGEYKALVLVKRGPSRTNLAISCTKAVHRSLLAALKSEWSVAA